MEDCSMGAAASSICATAAVCALPFWPVPSLAIKSSRVYCFGSIKGPVNRITPDLNGTKLSAVWEDFALSPENCFAPTGLDPFWVGYPGLRSCLASPWAGLGRAFGPQTEGA